jgi:hypothetical protein
LNQLVKELPKYESVLDKLEIELDSLNDVNGRTEERLLATSTTLDRLQMKLAGSQESTLSAKHEDLALKRETALFCLNKIAENENMKMKELRDFELLLEGSVFFFFFK